MQLNKPTKRKENNRDVKVFLIAILFCNMFFFLTENSIYMAKLNIYFVM